MQELTSDGKSGGTQKVDFLDTCPRVQAPTPMQVEATSTQMASSRRAAELPFFQQQTGSQCGLTALNNALQEARFTTESMQAAADAYLSGLEGIDERRAHF